ncbi:MAG: IS66 family transposase [Proteobacteria bacterium]|nr:IS66 family transposase [Pseudomonadota bacterium]
MDSTQQLALGDVLAPSSQTVPTLERPLAARIRRDPRKDGAVGEAESVPFFDEARVPVETIELPNPGIAGLAPHEYEVISQKVTYRLAQRPGSYAVLKYLRSVVKRRDTQAISCAPAPASVIEGSRADVSFVAGLLVDKFLYHLPLYRQHQRLQDMGFQVSRPWLTQLSQQSIRLLKPVYEAQFDSIRASRVKAMDETLIKAGRKERGKMKLAYFWPVYGEHNEVCFPYYPSREAQRVYQSLGADPGPGSVILTDGYASHAKKVGIAHALCWSHSRREFVEAQMSEPDGSLKALRRISALYAIYAIEEDIRNRGLTREAKQLHRLAHSRRHVEDFFAWVDRCREAHGLRPTTPFTQALNYVCERRLGLELFLTDLDVPLDTNHLTHGPRSVPMGRKNWNFCWTELGAEQVGIVQSLIVTCRLHGIDVYTYLVDVLQRVTHHPAAKVADLTPRMWKSIFASRPLRASGQQ